jgi:hypothetical protein
MNSLKSVAFEGGPDPVRTGKQTDFGWFFPGKTDELIAAVIASQAQAPEAPERVPGSLGRSLTQGWEREPDPAAQPRGPSCAEVWRCLLPVRESSRVTTHIGVNHQPTEGVFKELELPA